ncbi:hypothetical protein FA15DRAFT_54519 [Coprinopsis marcescibilis]|uniref:RING-type domain-containing protein n=1 Tax=Coprinopsis marcescibilis TaxID=230819 RepID=A0A5C3KNF3_COPMA|nr:hypothetical protein FA15DRAFT_54519 [Coprinopsis marcescibilis]
MFSLIFVVLWSFATVSAYVPALPSNSSNSSGRDLAEDSVLSIHWHLEGYYRQNVIYQLAGMDSGGISKGVLVHFSEEIADENTPPTNTPWIAMVSCDKNATNYSMEVDIFTLARDKGAVALLYSLDSQECVINPEYADPETFDQVFDIFSTNSRNNARMIEYQFGQLSPQQGNILNYDSKRLNDSHEDISKSIESGKARSEGYLYVVLRAWNATDSLTQANEHGVDTKPPDTDNRSTSQSTNLAMIVLYVITGCVSALFCVVIITGAVRAFRHPERYGPRVGGLDGESGGQSRARGLTRAILDTFPVVKFGSSSDSAESARQVKDIESSTDTHAGIALQPVSSRSAKSEKPSEISTAAESSTKTEEQLISQIQSANVPGNSSNQASSALSVIPVRSRQPSEGPRSSKNADEVVPDAIGRETCPICIVDFEEGDDIRVLPCEGKHCFHQTCVDPWLLELSSSCPICRHDFHALENMISGRSDDGGHEDVDHQEPEHSPHQHQHTNRFSRYVRFAVGRRRRRHDEPDPTDPYMPQAPVTSIYAGM